MRLKLLSADVELTAGNWAAAEQTLRGVIAGDASQLEAYGLLGRVYASQGKVDDAVQQYEALARRSPSGAASAKTMIGMLQEAKKDRQAARTAYEQALASDPHAGVAANNLAWIYASEGKLDQALRLATTAKAALRRRPEAEDTLGWIYLQKGLSSQAIAAFEWARDRAPKNPVYHYHLGLAHVKSGDPSRARTSFARALQLQPNFADAADARAQLAAVSEPARLALSAASSAGCSRHRLPRNCSASARCSTVTASDPARSAIVRPTRSTRSNARADSVSRLTAFSSSVRLGASSRTRAAQPPSFQPRVERRVPCELTASRGDHALANRRRSLAARISVQVARRNRGDRHRQVDAIAQWSGQPGGVALDLLRRAAARAQVAAGIPARARIHRAHQHEGGGEGRGAGGARDPHRPFFEWLPQHFQDVAAELRHLVEEQHAVMRQADLARPRDRPATDQRDIADGVMRRPERPRREQSRTCRDQPRDRMHGRHLHRFVLGERRQNAGQPSRHHGLSGAGRADQERVVAARGRDLQRPPGQQLTMHVREVRHGAPPEGRPRWPRAADDRSSGDR